MSTTFTDRPEHDPGASGQYFTFERDGVLVTGFEFCSGGARLRVLDGVRVTKGSNVGWSWNELEDLSAKLDVSTPSPPESQRFGLMYLPEMLSTQTGGLQSDQPVRVIFIDHVHHTATQVSVAPAHNIEGGMVCQQEPGHYDVDSDGFTISDGGTVCIFTVNFPPQTEQKTPKPQIHYGGVDDVFEVLRQAAECADRYELNKPSSRLRTMARFLGSNV